MYKYLHTKQLVITTQLFWSIRYKKHLAKNHKVKFWKHR